MIFFAAPRRVWPAAVHIVDDAGQTITLSQPGQRIVPLYGAFMEMLFAIGADSRIVGRTQADKWPEEVSNLPSVGTHMRPNVEIILGLKPDLVVQSISRREALTEMDRLRDAGIPVAVFAPRTFEEIFSVMMRLGALTAGEEKARSVVEQLQGRLEAVRGRVTGMEKPRRVFFELRAEPLTTAGTASIVHEIIGAAGAQNVVSNDKAVVLYNFEALLLDDPDAYIIQEGPMNRNPLDPAKRTHFGRLRAVREGRVLYVDEFIYSRPGPRCVEAVERLAAALYPERFGSGTR